MADTPDLPLETQAAIEHARQSVVSKRLQYQMLFPMLSDMILAVSEPALTPKLPKPAHLKLELQGYSAALFDAEACHYVKHASSDSELRSWLLGLKSRIEKEVARDLEARKESHDKHCNAAERAIAVSDGLLSRIEHWAKAAESDLDAILARSKAALARSATVTGGTAKQSEINDATRVQQQLKETRKRAEIDNEASKRFEIEQEVERLRNAARTPESVASSSQGITVTPKPERASRLPGTISSHVAARRMEAYINRGIGSTKFAIQAGTTDRTLRTFRKTGKVRRDIFEGIAKAMGLSREDLLKPEPPPTGN